jgi:hypothetical protein
MSKHEQNLIQILTNQRNSAMDEAAHLAANLLTLQESFSLYRKQQEEKATLEKASESESDEFHRELGEPLVPMAQQMMLDDML